MKISHPINSLYPIRSPHSPHRSGRSADAREPASPSGPQGIQQIRQEKVVDGEVLRKETAPTYEVFSKSRVFQQTAVRLAGEGHNRQAIASYETNRAAVQNDENNKGQNIDLYI